MKHTLTAVGGTFVLGLLVLSSGTLRATDTPSQDAGTVLEQLEALQAGITDLQASGVLSDKSAKSLGHHLDKVEKALAAATEPASSDDVSAQQLLDPVLKALQTAIDALLDFIGELTHLVTDLPAEVIQPIIDGAIELLRDLFSLLLG